MNTNDTPEGDDLATQPLEHTTAQPAPTAADSPLRRHSVGIAITAAVLAVIVVAGGTAWGVSAAVAGSQTTSSAPIAAEDASHATDAKAGKHGKGKAHGAVGTITAINGDTWTLHAASGATVSVKLTSTTAYGTKKAPSTASSFAVGDKVGALGARSGDTVTATRIVHAPAQTRMGTATPAPTAGT